MVAYAAEMPFYFGLTAGCEPIASIAKRLLMVPQ